MTADSVDLLPPERRRVLRRAYLLRLTIVGALLSLALVLAAAALLIPTYFYLRSTERTQSSRLAVIESTIASADESALGQQLASLEADAARIAALSSTASASAVIRNTLAVGRPSIVLTGLSYAPAVTAQPGTLAISGVAATRNDLRAYQLALLSAPGFSGADLPVSSYAKDHDIPFTITVTLATSTLL